MKKKYVYIYIHTQHTFFPCTRVNGRVNCAVHIFTERPRSCTAVVNVNRSPDVKSSSSRACARKPRFENRSLSGSVPRPPLITFDISLMKNTSLFPARGKVTEERNNKALLVGCAKHSSRTREGEKNCMQLLNKYNKIYLYSLRKRKKKSASKIQLMLDRVNVIRAILIII